MTPLSDTGLLRTLALALWLLTASHGTLAQTPSDPAAAAYGTVAAPAGDWRPSLEGRALVVALQRGGYVLYLRHTSTDFGENDNNMTDYRDCATQRNLTDAGRAEARAIGAALRELKIPIGTVNASPYCRTLETGRLVFGKATISPAVRGGPAQPETPDRYAQLRVMLSTPVPAGSNLAISSHGNPFYGVAGPPYLAEGEMAVVEPQGGGRFRIVAKITRTAWPALVASR